MKTINDPNNPVMILTLSAEEGLMLAYYNDITKHIEHYMQGALPIVQSLPDHAGIQWTIAKASTEDIERFEDDIGRAVPTFEQARDEADAANSPYFHKVN